jgi:hypothetical protein
MTNNKFEEEENRSQKIPLDELNYIIEENKNLKIELNEYKDKNLEIKYRELLLDYEKIQLQSNENIEHNEKLIKNNEILEKEANNYND